MAASDVVGAAQALQVRAEDGRMLRFPAAALRRFTTREGVYGRFEIGFDAGQRLTVLRRIGP